MSHISHLAHIGSPVWASSFSFSEILSVHESWADTWLVSDVAAARAIRAADQITMRRVFNAEPIIAVVPLSVTIAAEMIRVTCCAKIDKAFIRESVVLVRDGEAATVEEHRRSARTTSEE